eukprot:TRINITY_DN62514_c0_g1_i1.p1 TRINITY_DN62514_c0_g1~~TRINITY_DN62514_c0_g1_i1.p1  ORF type:complete len:333 (+),score=30.81 TRINITY_DN62514_c0_g1_i1:68-1066(+)
MGRLEGLFSLGLTAISGVLNFCATLSPVTVQSWSVVVPVVNMKTYLLSVYVSFPSPSARAKLCQNHNTVMCAIEQFEGRSSYNSAASLLCGGARHVIQNGCDAFKTAGSWGIILLICIVINIACLGVSGWFCYRYLYLLPSTKARQVTLYTNIAGAVFHFAAISLYCMNVIPGLMQIGPSASNFLTVPNNPALSWGVILGWLALAVQCVAIALETRMKTADETRLADAREESEFQAEMRSVQHEQNLGMYDTPFQHQQNLGMDHQHFQGQQDFGIQKPFQQQGFFGTTPGYNQSTQGYAGTVPSNQVAGPGFDSRGQYNDAFGPPQRGGPWG